MRIRAENRQEAQIDRAAGRNLHRRRAAQRQRSPEFEVGISALELGLRNRDHVIRVVQTYRTSAGQTEFLISKLQRGKLDASLDLRRIRQGAIDLPSKLRISLKLTAHGRQIRCQQWPKLQRTDFESAVDQVRSIQGCITIRANFPARNIGGEREIHSLVRNVELSIQRS